MTSKTDKPDALGPDTGTLYTGTQEPHLSDLLSDPILHAILQRDGLPLSTLQDVIATAQRRLVA